MPPNYGRPICLIPQVVRGTLTYSAHFYLYYSWWTACEGTHQQHTFPAQRDGGSITGLRHATSPDERQNIESFSFAPITLSNLSTTHEAVGQPETQSNALALSVTAVRCFEGVRVRVSIRKQMRK